MWNGLGWLPGCLAAVAAQTSPAAETIMVDNGSRDGSVEYLQRHHPSVQVIALDHNTGFAHAANTGINAAAGEFIALLNTDVLLDADWLRRLVTTLSEHPDAAAVACKMVQLDQPELVYDAGDVLRRDGACEQRGRFGPDDGRWDEPGEVFAACAGAALYRRQAVLDVGGFDERYFAYLEDVDLGLRLRLRGWRCRYEPAVARHAGEGSSHQLRGGHQYLVERNTLFLVARAFPLRWLPLVAYRQLSWARTAIRDRRFGSHVRGLVAGMAMGWRGRRERRTLRREATVPIEVVVPSMPFRGPAAGGHAAQLEKRPSEM